MAEASQEVFQSKTLYLKVSIHCEGCKKKVKRVLEKIPGVDKVEIDSFQHKVSVTCRVDHDTLIRKLQKSHKQASVWPEAKQPGTNLSPGTSSDNKKQNKESNIKPKDKEHKESSENPKEKQPEPVKEKNPDKGHDNEKVKEKPKAEDEIKSKPQEKEKEKEKDVVKEKPKEKEEKEKEPSEKEAKQNSISENKKEMADHKEKKIESSGKEGAQHMDRGGISPPQPNQEFMNPYSYPYQPQPIMSYNMAQPSSSQAYYLQPPMPDMQNHMHPYQNPYPYPYQYPYGTPSAYQYGPTESSSRGHESLDYFNEENTNSCSIM